MFILKNTNRSEKFDAILNAETLKSLVNVLEKGDHEHVSTVDLAKILPNVNTKQINSFLEEMGYVINVKGYWIVADKAIEREYFYNIVGYQMPFVTEKGIRFLIDLYINGDLPSRKS